MYERVHTYYSIVNRFITDNCNYAYQSQNAGKDGAGPLQHNRVADAEVLALFSARDAGVGGHAVEMIEASGGR